MKTTIRTFDCGSLGALVLCLSVPACGENSSSGATPLVDAAASTSDGSEEVTLDRSSTNVVTTHGGDENSAPGGTAPTSSSPSPTTSEAVSTAPGTTPESGGSTDEGYAPDGGVAPGADASSEATCDGCVIDGQCYETGSLEPGNACAQCLPSVDDAGWSARENGLACDDNLACNGQDSCQAGECTHAGSPCGDREMCEETASEGFECQCTSAWTGPECQRCVLHVTPNGNDANSGSSWSEALATISRALTNATDGGCEIWVATGTYRPVPEPYGDPHYASLRLVSGVDLYGGFAGTESSLEERDLVANETILSGDLAADDNPEELDTLIDNSYRVVTGADNARIDGFTITAGNAVYGLGGGVYINQTSPTVANCLIADNFANEGGGMYVYSGAPLIENCVFANNTSESYGGGALVNSSNNSAMGPTFTGCRFSGNTAATRGGGLCAIGAAMVVSDSEFTNNDAPGGGGAIYGESSDYTISGSSFTGNSAAQDGGAVRHYDGTLDLADCIFIDNVSSFFGGALNADETLLSVHGSTFSGNTAMGGGALSTTTGTTTIDDCSFETNAAINGNGGAISTSANAHTTIRHSTVTGNTTVYGGAGLDVTAGTLVLVDVLVSSNTALDSGAGLSASNSSVLTAFGCTLEGNVGEYGSAMYVQQSSLVLEGSVLHHNAASWDGGALAIFDSPSVRITNSTLADNSAARGGAAAVWGSNVVIANSILWGNTALESDPTLYGSATVSYSDVQGACVEGECLNGNRNIDPGFAAPESADYSLQAGSPLIDSGNNLAIEVDATDLDGDEDVAEGVPFDQAGNPRIANEVVDIGAYEFTP